MQWKASRKSRQILGRGMACRTNTFACQFYWKWVFRRHSHINTRIARRASMRRVQQLHDATGCIGENFGVFRTVGLGLRRRLRRHRCAHSYGIRFYNNIPVNRRLQTISNVKRKSKQHIKWVRALLRALGLTQCSQRQQHHRHQCAPCRYCLLPFVFVYCHSMAKSHLPTWSHVNAEWVNSRSHEN